MTAPAPKATKTHTPRPIMPDLEDFYTTAEAAEKLGFNIRSIPYLIKHNRLEGVKIGGKTWLVSKKSVADYLKKTEGMSKNDPRRKADK